MQFDFDYPFTPPIIKLISNNFLESYIDSNNIIRLKILEIENWRPILT